VNISEKLISVIITITALVISAETAYACSSTASYRSVIVNDAPKVIPVGSTTFKIKVESALVSPSTKDIYGLSGVLVTTADQYQLGTKVEVHAKLSSMCDTWFDVWTPNPNVDSEGKLIGYLTGYIENAVDDEGLIKLEPLLFRRSADIEKHGSDDYNKGQPASLSKNRLRPLPKDVIWKPLKIDAAQISSNLSDTNAIIQEHLEEMDKDKAAKAKAKKDDQ
jgi:hypothetical protein